MDFSRPLEDNLDELKKITVDLTNIDEKISYENKTIIILNSLLDFYTKLKVSIRYGGDSLTFQVLLEPCSPWNLKLSSKRDHNQLEGLNVKGRSSKRDISKGRGRSRFQSKGRKDCWYYQKEGDIKKFYPKRNKGSRNQLEK